jgi:hypothetical protein
MLYRFFLKTLFICFFATQAFAAPKQLPQNRFAAKATADALNSFKSVGDYITWLGMVTNKEDLEKVRAELVKLGVDLKAKFPKANYKNEKVYFDKDNWIMYGNNSLTVNGKKVALNRQSAHEIFLGICAQIGCKKTTADFSFFNKAHAAFEWKGALAGAAALGGLAYLFGPPGALAKGAFAGFILGGLFMNRAHNAACNSGLFSSSNHCKPDYADGSCGYDNGPQREQIYGPVDQEQCSHVGTLIADNSSYLGWNGDSSGGGGELDQALGATSATAGTKDGKAKRGTTSVPKK